MTVDGIGHRWPSLRPSTGSEAIGFRFDHADVSRQKKERENYISLIRSRG